MSGEIKAYIYRMKRYIYYIITLFIIFSCSREKKEWYSIKKLDDKTYIISESYSSQKNSSYLIIGDEKAILFDAGTGGNKDNSTRSVTDSLTKKPITLLLSHFHYDHVGCVRNYDRVMLPYLKLLKDRLTTDSLLHLNKRDLFLNDTLTVKISGFLPIGEYIDLGNRKIRIFHTPGHTEESISIIDDDRGYIFAGDLIYNELLLMNNCQAYIQSINKLLKNSKSNYRIFGAHGKPEVEYSYLTKIKTVIEQYIDSDSSFKPARKIKFYGKMKELYEKDGVSFIIRYNDQLE